MVAYFSIGILCDLDSSIYVGKSNLVGYNKSLGNFYLEIVCLQTPHPLKTSLKTTPTFCNYSQIFNIQASRINRGAMTF